MGFRRREHGILYYFPSLAGRCGSHEEGLDVCREPWRRFKREAQINGLSPHAVDEYEYTARDDLEWRIRTAEEDLPPGVKKLTEEDIAEFEALFRDLEERYNERHGVTEVGESDDAVEKETDAEMEKDIETDVESEAGWETASEGGEAKGSGSAGQI